MRATFAGPVFLAFRLIAILFGASACGGASSTPDRARVEVTDSAGVQLVRNLSSAADTAALELVEELRIGVIDGAEEYQFFRVTAVATDEAGRIYVADPGDRAVRVYDRDGRFVRGFGRPGQGPGEFTLPLALFVWRDTVQVADRGSAAGRSVLFDTAGTLLTTFPHLLPNGSLIVPIGASPAGWLVRDDSLFSRQAREEAGVVRRTLTSIARVAAADLPVAVVSRAAADSLLAPVIAFHGQRVFYALGSEGGSERVPLGNPPFFEPSSAYAIDGRGFVHVARGWPYVIETWDAAGRLVRRITRAHDSIPVTEAVVGEVMRRVRAHFDTLTDPRGVAGAAYERRAQLPRIGFVPVTSTLHASKDGWLWVRRVDLVPDPVTLAFAMGQPSPPSYWDVFDADGVLRHTVQLPPRFLLQAVTASSILGVVRGELDVQYVVRLGWRPHGGS